jgi:hypothetical protein
LGFAAPLGAVEFEGEEGDTMKKVYAVPMIAHTSFAVYVEAESPEAALDAANGYKGMEIGLCDQCSKDVDFVTVGEPIGIKAVCGFREGGGKRTLQEFQRRHGDGQ